MVCLCVTGGGLIDPRFPKAERLRAQGNLAEAAALYRELLSKFPNDPTSLMMLGLIAHQAGNLPLALQLIESSLAQHPDFAPAWFNRSILLRVLGREDDALRSTQMALEADPTLAEAWDMLAQILKTKGDLKEAIKAHQKAIELQPQNSQFYNNSASLLLEMNDLPGAFLAAQKAAELDPHYQPMVLGNILKAMGHAEPAALCFAKVRKIRPDYAEAAASEAMVRLQMGDMEEGWALWEQRPDLESKLKTIPFWDGQKVPSLLLYEDQGLGDALHFLRYIPFLENYASHISLRIAPSLYRLCSENFPLLSLLKEDNPLPDVDARCRLSSLPFFFQKDLAELPQTPYLHAQEDQRLSYRAKLEKNGRPRIGLVWAGNAQFLRDATRSIAFSHLTPLFADRPGHFISLQKNRPQDQVSLKSVALFDASDLIEDFSDTASLIAELDLVITVDTATAHLAGALGKPVFILLPFDSDWRWLIGREDSPWYKSARLFRQSSPGDWDTVIHSVHEALDKLWAGDTSVLLPAPWTSPCLHKNPYALPLPDPSIL
jgi:tetratricopeptide (TPR) repeat protein